MKITHVESFLFNPAAPATSCFARIDNGSGREKRAADILDSAPSAASPC